MSVACPSRLFPCLLFLSPSPSPLSLPLSGRDFPVWKRWAVPREVWSVLVPHHPFLGGAKSLIKA